MGIYQSQSDDQNVAIEAEPKVSQSPRSHEWNTATPIIAWPPICSRTNLAGRHMASPPYDHHPGTSIIY